MTKIHEQAAAAYAALGVRPLLVGGHVSVVPNYGNGYGMPVTSRGIRLSVPAAIALQRRPEVFKKAILQAGLRPGGYLVYRSVTRLFTNGSALAGLLDGCSKQPLGPHVLPANARFVRRAYDVWYEIGRECHRVLVELN